MVASGMVTTLTFEQAHTVQGGGCSCGIMRATEQQGFARFVCTGKKLQQSLG